MSTARPEYHLQRVNSDGSAGPLEILPLEAFPETANVSRRGFVGAGLALGAVLAALDAEAQERNDLDLVPQAGDQLKAHVGAVRGLQFTPDGERLVSAAGDRTVKCWSLAEGALLHTMAGHQGMVNTVAVTADGKFAFSGADDRTVRLWSLADGTQRAMLSGHKAPVHAVLVTPDKSTLISGSADKAVKLWSMANGKPLNTLPGHKGAVKALAVIPNGQGLVSASADGTIKLWSLAKRRFLWDLPGVESPANALALASQGKWLATGADDAAIRLYRLSDRTKLETLQGHQGAVHALCVLPDGERLVSAGDDKVVRIWSLPAGPVEDELVGHEAPIRSLAADPSGRWLASGDTSGTIILWDLESRLLHGYLFDPNCNHVEGFRYSITDEQTGQVRVYTLPCGSPLPAGATCICNCVPGTYQTTEVTVAQTGKAKPKPVRQPAPREPGVMSEKAAERAARREAARAAREEARIAREEERIAREMEKAMGDEPFGGWDDFGGGMGGGGMGGGTICTCNTICTCIPVCQAHRLLDPDAVTRTLAEELLLLMGRRELTYMLSALRRAEAPLRQRIGQVMAAVLRGVQTACSRWPTMPECLARLHHADEVTAIMAAQMAQQRAAHLGEAFDDDSQARIKQLLDEAQRRPWHVRFREETP